MQKANTITAESISLCKSCYCMTKTIEGKCGKCQAQKANTDAADLQLVRELRSAPQRELPAWEIEFDRKMQNYTDGKGEFGGKGSGIKGFWLRVGMDGDIDTEKIKSFIRTELQRTKRETRLEMAKHFNLNLPVEDVLEENTL